MPAHPHLPYASTWKWEKLCFWTEWVLLVRFSIIFSTHYHFWDFLFAFLFTLKAPRKILEQTTIFFYFLFFKENNAWHFMWIVCFAEDSHVMSSIISSEKYKYHALKLSSASRDWCFKGQQVSTLCFIQLIMYTLVKPIFFPAESGVF